MKIDPKDFRVREDHKVDLGKWPTRVKPAYKSKEEYKTLLEEHVAKLSKIQELHFASNRHALLVILQAMDAAGKDGTIRHVMSGVNPQGCRRLIPLTQVSTSSRFRRAMGPESAAEAQKASLRRSLITTTVCRRLMPPSGVRLFVGST
jgi:polyphosphate kinase 2 (PPK2 family)